MQTTLVRPSRDPAVEPSPFTETIAHDPRLPAPQQPTSEHVSAGDIEDQTFGTGQVGRRHSPAENKPSPMNDASERFGMGPFSFGAYRPLTSPDLLEVRVASA